MKKILLFLTLLTVPLFLTSCKVNWFGDTLDVPWYYVVIPVVLVFVVAYALIMAQTYICPHCKTKFKAKPYQLYVTVHFNGKRIAKCPNCKRKGFCEVKSLLNKDK